MRSLIDKLENAAVGTRDLSREIAALIGTVTVHREFDGAMDAAEYAAFPCYTTSVDAALTLVPEDWFPNFLEGPFPKGFQPYDLGGRSCRAMLRERMAHKPQDAGGLGHSLALAICAAAVRARMKAGLLADLPAAA